MSDPFPSRRIYPFDVEVAAGKGHAPLPENVSVTPERVIALRSELTEDQVREGRF